MLIPLSSWLFDMHLNTEAKHCPSPESVLSLCSLLATCFLLWLAWVKLLCELGHLCSLSFSFQITRSVLSLPQSFSLFLSARHSNFSSRCKQMDLPAQPCDQTLPIWPPSSLDMLTEHIFFFFKKQKPQS